MKQAFFAISLASGLVMTGIIGGAQSQPHPILDATGFQQNRDYFSEAPFENSTH